MAVIWIQWWYLWNDYSYMITHSYTITHIMQNGS